MLVFSEFIKPDNERFTKCVQDICDQDKFTGIELDDRHI